MKKISFILMLACVGFFAACSDDKKDPVPPADKDYAKEIASRYVGELVVVAPLDPESEPITDITESAIEVKSRSLNTIDLSLKDFVFLGDVETGDILLEEIKVEGNDTEVKIVAKSFANYDLIGMEGITINVKGNNVVGDKIDLDLEILVPGFKDPITVTFKGVKSDKPILNKEAKIVSMKLDSELIEKQPVIEEGQTEILVNLKKGVEFSELNDVMLTIEVSKNATVEPATETKIDLSSGSKEIVVTAEDKETKVTYTLKLVTAEGKVKHVFDFETWDESKKYSTPITTGVTWASSNNGLSLVASSIPYFPIQSTDITPSGSGKAALIETMNTKGIMSMIPAITAGSLFTGTFNAFSGISNPLKATDFSGYEFKEKPVEMTVYYKYLPGEVFYRSSFEGRADATPEEGTTDQCAINAILYDITDDSKTKITGDKPYEDARIIAKAMFTGDKQESYIKKRVKFEFSKEYDASRKYRLAIITTSSAGGDTFSGAPGSKLYLDNIEIITE